MTVAKGIIALLGYFFIVQIVIICLSAGNMFDSDTSMSYTSGINASSSLNMTAPTSSSIWDTGTFLWDLIGFSLIGFWFHFGALAGFILNFLFVFIPGLILVVLVVMAIRGGSS